MARMGHDSERAAMIYQHEARGADQTITQQYQVQGVSDPLTLTSMGKFDLSSTAGTIPIELTTGLRIALLVSIYAGVGFDITGGKSTVDGDLTGTMTTPDKTNIGTVHITETGSNTSSPGQFRGLAGVQVNLWKVKVYAQANVSQIPAASLGVRTAPPLAGLPPARLPSVGRSTALARAAAPAVRSRRSICSAACTPARGT